MPDIPEKKRICVAVTGASGAAYGKRLVEALAEGGHEVLLVISHAGAEVLRHECACTPGDLVRGGVTLFDEEEIGAPPASGTNAPDGMAVCPCSMATLAAVAHGFANNLVRRAADVMLKEKRPLVLVPRETGLSRIHLENLLRAHDAGAVILPAMPPFYGRPRSVEELVDHFVGRVLDRLDVPNQLTPRWEGTG